MQPMSARILVVDDDVEIQRVLKRAAESAGFEVVQAFDGPAGLTLAAQEKFDLIVLDISMPTSDGRDVLNRVKQDPNTAGIPVLLYSGSDLADNRRVGYELGAADFVEKPFDAGLLITKIGRIIEKARR